MQIRINFKPFRFQLFSVIFALSLFGAKVKADVERMGTFRFSEFSMSPQIRNEEPSRGGFELRESWLGFEWQRDESLSGSISFGSSDLTSPAIWYEAKKGQLDLVEASVTAKTPYFDIRAGLLPIANGYEGAFPEWEWQLPMTRVRDHRWLTRRDYGIELRAESKPFLTSVTVHNGESGSNIDQKMWETFLWRYQNSEGFGALATAEVGRTNTQSTANSATELSKEGFAFDVNEPSKYRHGSLAFYRKWKRHLVLLEVARGEILQNDDKFPFAWGHFDVCANLGGDLNLLFRYEQSQSNLRLTSTMVKTLGFGFSLTSVDRLSSVTLWGNKNFEDPEVHNDQAFLIFRLNSNILN